MEDLYCKIYVETEMSRSRLADFLASHLPGTRERNTVDSNLLVIDIRENEDRKGGRFSPNWEGFVYSRFYLDVDPSQGADRSSYVKLVARILELLRSVGAHAIAACDFEEELPQPMLRGGGGDRGKNDGA